MAMGVSNHWDVEVVMDVIVDEGNHIRTQAITVILDQGATIPLELAVVEWGFLQSENSHKQS